MGDIKACQSTAHVKHAAHIRYVTCVEMGDIKACQSAATAKHAAHIRYIRGVETGQIKACQLVAVKKHSIHIRNMFCIKATTKYNTGYVMSFVIVFRKIITFFRYNTGKHTRTI